MTTDSAPNNEGYWQTKYKTIRAVHMERMRAFRRLEREAGKNVQRLAAWKEKYETALINCTAYMKDSEVRVNDWKAKYEAAVGAANFFRDLGDEGFDEETMTVDKEIEKRLLDKSRSVGGED